MSFELLGFVVNEPITEKPSDRPTCPWCGSTDIEKSASYQTLVGGSTDIDLDPNHHWGHYTCHSCKSLCIREFRSGKVWYTLNGKLLRGVPNCWESYVYKCKCGGDVRRKDTNDRFLFECASCKSSITTENDYPGGPKHRPGICEIDPSIARKLRLGWTIEEEIGVVLVNDYAISKVSVNE